MARPERNQDAVEAASPMDLRTLRPPRQLLPVRERTAQEDQQLEAKLEWFYRARYGVFVHFVPRMGRHMQGPAWTSEQWNRWVDDVDVEAFAGQVEQIGAGYVVLTICASNDYYCAPNPVLESIWGFEPGEFGSTRDLPMDLYEALDKSDIRLLLYVNSTPPSTTCDRARSRARAAGWTAGFDTTGSRPRLQSSYTELGLENWAEALRWWSDHYGERCAGWWIDGARDAYQGGKVHEAVKSGHPKAIAASHWYALSDYHHGHCANWEEQRQRIPRQDPSPWAERLLPSEQVARPVAPEVGRWVRPFQARPGFRIQYHVAQYLGKSWASPGVAHPTREMVDYTKAVVQRGGVFSFDIGTFRVHDSPALGDGPYLRVPDEQMEQLRAVHDALRGVRG